MKDINLEEFTLYSGGAKGSDFYWDLIGSRFGITNRVDFRPESLYGLYLSELIEIEKAYERAVKDLGRKELLPSTYAGKLVRRDYLQAKYADAVFAISVLVAPGEKDPNPKGYINKTKKVLVAGGTAYAVQMAINLGKPVYVFDQIKNKWFTWENNTFVEITHAPFLTLKFAGIGTREINEAGKSAILACYKNTIAKKYLPH